MPETDPVRKHFAENVEKIAAVQADRAEQLAERVYRFVAPSGDEAVLDVATGTGALALALASSVRRVVGVDVVPELLEVAERLGAGFSNVSFQEADAARLPFDDFSFDLTGTMRSLHHIERPEIAMAEIVRVTRLKGRILVVDQIAPTDPLVALQLDAFERARDPTFTRFLSDADMRGLFDMNSLRLLASEAEPERRDLERYLDLAGCVGEDRERARRLAPGPEFQTDLGWYLLARV